MYKDKIDIAGGIRSIGAMLRGLYTGAVEGWRLYKTVGTPLAAHEVARLKRIPFLLPDRIASLIGSHMLGRSVVMHRQHNVITVNGRQQLLKAAAGLVGHVREVAITHQQLGTSTTQPNANDTELGAAETGTLKTISSIGVAGSQMNITSFWAAGEATGAHKELGTYMYGFNADGTLNSNRILFNHVAIDVTVQASEALTVDGTVSMQ